jgi:hypothetical protein
MIRSHPRLKARLALGACALGVVLAAAPAVSDTATSPFWEPPTDLRHRDLFLGPGALAALRSDGHLQFLRPKRRRQSRRDRARRSRPRVAHQAATHNNQGDESPVEVVLSRVLSAVGYHQPPIYFLPSFRSPTHRAHGSFRAAASDW